MGKIPCKILYTYLQIRTAVSKNIYENLNKDMIKNPIILLFGVLRVTDFEWRKRRAEYLGSGCLNAMEAAARAAAASAAASLPGEVEVIL